MSRLLVKGKGPKLVWKCAKNKTLTLRWTQVFVSKKTEMLAESYLNKTTSSCEWIFPILWHDGELEENERTFLVQCAGNPQRKLWREVLTWKQRQAYHHLYVIKMVRSLSNIKRSPIYTNLCEQVPALCSKGDYSMVLYARAMKTTMGPYAFHRWFALNAVEASLSEVSHAKKRTTMDIRPCALRLQKRGEWVEELVRKMVSIDYYISQLSSGKRAVPSVGSGHRLVDVVGLLDVKSDDKPLTHKLGVRRAIGWLCTYTWMELGLSDMLPLRASLKTLRAYRFKFVDATDRAYDLPLVETSHQPRHGPKRKAANPPMRHGDDGSVSNSAIGLELSFDPPQDKRRRVNPFGFGPGIPL